MHIKLSDLNALSFFSDNISKFLFWKDKNSVFLGCNESFAKYAGLNKKDEIIGKTDFDLPWSKKESYLSISIDQRVMKSGIPEIDFEESKTLHNNEKRWLLTSKMPLHNSDDEVIGIIGWFTDITEIKLLQFDIIEKSNQLSKSNLDLKKINKKLELANLDLENFTYAASHDLKAPLVGVIGVLELIKTKSTNLLDAQFIYLLNEGINAIKAMETLINDILAFARSGAENAMLKLANLKDVVSDKIKSLNHLIVERNVQFSVNLPASKINCYPELLGMVFYNLINNAIKFNQSKSPFFKVDYLDETDHWIFTVSDNGIGIEDKNKTKIFDAFSRLHTAKEYEGSGIGLSICKRIVNMHQGEIWISDQADGGSVFTFTISKNLNKQ